MNYDFPGTICSIAALGSNLRVRQVPLPPEVVIELDHDFELRSA